MFALYTSRNILVISDGAPTRAIPSPGIPPALQIPFANTNLVSTFSRRAENDDGTIRQLADHARSEACVQDIPEN